MGWSSLLFESPCFTSLNVKELRQELRKEISIVYLAGLSVKSNIQTLCEQLSYFEGKFKELEEENTQFRLLCNEKFMASSLEHVRSLEQLKEKNAIVEQEVDVLR